MTEKRFTYIKNSSITQYQSIPIQKIGKGKPFHCQGLVDELNKLWNENEKLKEENKELKKESYGNLDGLESYKALYSDVCEKYDNLEADYDDLKKENEQLKSELRTLRDFRGFITEKNVFNEKELQKTQKELILIKNTIKEMYDNERTHLGHNVLAQLMGAIQ